MSKATATFPERINIEGRDDFYLRASKPDEAGQIFELICDNQYIGDFQHWAKDDTLEKTEKGIRDRFEAIAAGTSVQYRLVDPKQAEHGGVIGTLTVFGYDKEKSAAKIGYYQAKNSQGKGRMVMSVSKVIDLLRSVWNVKTVEFGIADDNYPSMKLVKKLGAHKTDELVACNCSDHCADVMVRTWRLEV